MMLRAKSPRPLMRFSERSSGTTCLMLPTLTLLTIPVIDLRRVSQERRWYSALLRSCPAAAWRARSRAGGMYTPPDREDVSLANSAMASNFLLLCAAFLVVGLAELDSSHASGKLALPFCSANRIDVLYPGNIPLLHAVVGGECDLRRMGEDHCRGSESETYNLLRAK
jgi:hypothetical protein